MVVLMVVLRVVLLVVLRAVLRVVLRVVLRMVLIAAWCTAAQCETPLRGSSNRQKTTRPLSVCRLSRTKGCSGGCPKARRHQTCHFRKRAASVPAEGHACSLDFARHCEFPLRALQARKWHVMFTKVARLVPPDCFHGVKSPQSKGALLALQKISPWRILVEKYEEGDWPHFQREIFSPKILLPTFSNPTL